MGKHPSQYRVQVELLLWWIDRGAVSSGLGGKLGVLVSRDKTPTIPSVRR